MPEPELKKAELVNKEANIEIRNEKEFTEAKQALRQFSDNIEDSKPQEDVFGLSTISKQLTNPEKLHFLTNVTKEESNKYALLYAIMEEMKTHSKPHQMIKTYLDTKLTLNVSVKGQRAKDIKEIAKTAGTALSIMLGAGNTGQQDTGLVDRIKNKLRPKGD